MKKKELLVSEILSAFNQKRKVKGHFSKKVYNLGDMKFGLDIFTFLLRKNGDDYYIKMTGLYRHGVVRLLEHLGVCYKKEHDAFILIRNQSNIICEISQKADKTVYRKISFVFQKYDRGAKGLDKRRRHGIGFLSWLDSVSSTVK